MVSDLTPNEVKPTVVISFSDALLEQSDFAAIEPFYQAEQLVTIVSQVLVFLAAHQDIALPEHLADALFAKPSEVEVYITEPVEAREINLEARNKDYATNILSYPSELPEAVIALLPSLSLGELVICHEVVAKQAEEQGKTVKAHLTHLLVHGVLHLLGFDHELGQAEQDEMENIEIAVLAKLGIDNPYLTD